MTKVNSFEDLIVWQKAVDLSVCLYKITSKFPKEETFGSTSQLRRAVNSVSLNISEGSVKTTKVFVYHLRIANGNAAETLSASILANKLGYMSDDGLSLVRKQVSEVTKILNKLISSLQEKIKSVERLV
jgi:four helix bundle protein